jgi:hypothetical protein
MLKFSGWSCPDFQPCSPRACTALNTAVRSSGRSALPLPESRFRLPPDQRFQARRSLSSDRSRSLATAFRSPATVSDFSDPIPGSTFPACRFATRPIASTARSAFRSATDSRSRPKPATSTLRPVAASTISLACRCSGLHSPSGPLRPSGSERSAGLLQAGPPSELARSPFAPRYVRYF